MFTKEDFVVLAEQAKEIMTLLGLDIEDKGIPELEKAGAEVFGDVAVMAGYSPDLHKVFVNTRYEAEFNARPSTLYEILIHELTHAYQPKNTLVNVSTDVFSDEYWNQEFEREATSVSLIWISLFGELKDVLATEDKTYRDVYLEAIETQDKDTLLTKYTTIVRGIFNSKLETGV